MALTERFVVDEKGDRVGVLLDMKAYLKMLEELEELECLRAFDAAKASTDAVISFDQAVAEIEQDRR